MTTSEAVALARGVLSYERMRGADNPAQPGRACRDGFVRDAADLARAVIELADENERLQSLLALRSPDEVG